MVVNVLEFVAILYFKRQVGSRKTLICDVVNLGVRSGLDYISQSVTGNAKDTLA